MEYVKFVPITIESVSIKRKWLFQIVWIVHFYLADTQAVQSIHSHQVKLNRKQARELAETITFFSSGNPVVRCLQVESALIEPPIPNSGKYVLLNPFPGDVVYTMEQRHNSLFLITRLPRY